MRVAIANLTSGGLSGGYRKYLERIVPLLAGDPRVVSLTMFVPPQQRLELESDIDVRAWAAGDASGGFSGLARRVRELKPDVVFVPTARHAGFGGIPVVTMVHNMEPLTVPFAGHTWKEGLRNAARAWAARRACERSTRIIAVSDHVREFLVRRWGIDGTRVRTVYHGVDRGGQSTATARAPATLFTAGSIRPARGLEDAIAALALLGNGVRLVIAGRIDAGCEPYGRRLTRLAADSGVASRIIWAGQLGAQEMHDAFRTATAFLMTSRAEACPMTALEAMSCGCAIVSSDCPPMPEVFADAARYYRTGQPRSLAAALEPLLTDPMAHRRAGDAARARAAAFTWETTRDRTIEELQRALS